MAQIDDGGGDNPNVELNLVPFIDLMCVCITFLLITAVWAQVSLIQLGTSIYGQKSSDSKTIEKPQDIVAFRMDVKKSGFLLNVGLDVVNIPKVSGQYDEATLVEELRKIKDRYPKKTDAVISVADDLPYDMMIRGMDSLIASGFADIGIATGEVR